MALSYGEGFRAHVSEEEEEEEVEGEDFNRRRQANALSRSTVTQDWEGDPHPSRTAPWWRGLYPNSPGLC
jgi:hypothetical protein